MLTLPSYHLLPHAATLDDPRLVATVFAPTNDAIERTLRDGGASKQQLLGVRAGAVVVCVACWAGGMVWFWSKGGGVAGWAGAVGWLVGQWPCARPILRDGKSNGGVSGSRPRVVISGGRPLT